MNFQEEVGTPCNSFGFSFTAISESNQPSRYLFEMLEKDDAKQMDRFESILQSISTLDSILPTSIEPPAQPKPAEIVHSGQIEESEELLSGTDSELTETESDEDEVAEKPSQKVKKGEEETANEEEDEEEEILFEVVHPSDEEEEEEEEEILAELEPEDANDESSNPVVRLQKKQFTKLTAEEGKEIARFSCKLQNYENKQFKNCGDIEVVVFEKKKFNYVLHFLAKESQSFFSFALANEKKPIYLDFDESKNSVEWTGKLENEIWGLKTVFPDDTFIKKLIELNWNTRNNADFGKLKAEDREYILRGALKRDYHNVHLDDEDEMIFDESEEEEEEEEEEAAAKSKKSKGVNRSERNSHLAVGHRHRDKAFVSRGKKVGVFKITEDNYLDYQTTFSSLHNNQSSIRQMMLHQQDEKMLFLDDASKNSIYSMDIERESIVNEWKTGDGFQVASIVPMSRFAQAENEQNFIGIQSGGAFVIDPRVNSKRQTVEKATSGFQYSRATNPSFSTAATTVDGDLIVGSQLGDVRVYRNDIVTREGNRKAYATNQFYLSGGLYFSLFFFFSPFFPLSPCT